jgi:hypothetical protein
MKISAASPLHEEVSKTCNKTATRWPTNTTARWPTTIAITTSTSHADERIQVLQEQLLLTLQLLLAVLLTST